MRRAHRLSLVLASVGAVVGSLVAVPAHATTPTSAEPAVRAAPARPRACPQLRRPELWYGDNAARLQRVIDRRGRCGWGATPPRARPYAVFDFDNTLIKNDISDQTIFWMLRHDKFLQPQRRDWRTTSRFMTDAGARALRDACGDLARPGRRLPTSTSTACADEILSVRKEQVTTDGAKVFAGYHHRRMQAMYAWVGQSLRGYTPAQARRIAAQARRAALRAPVGATQQVGSSTQVAWIRYYPAMRDLVATLERAGIEPWIVSASPKEFADVWGRGIGIDRRHTIGVSQLTTRGRLNGHLEGCGGIPDRADTIMTYVDGKRCFVNKRVLGLDGPRALRAAPRPLRPAIAGGDATTDVTMVGDATEAHVVLNRNDEEIMCRAYDDADGRWLVNPMFIQPLPRRSEPYPCSTTAATDADGDPVPVRRPDGSIVPDQRDTVHG